MKSLSEIAVTKVYWWVLIGLSMVLELVALYYQYALDEWPCVLCIQVRIWLMALILVSLVTLFIKENIKIFILMHGLATGIMVVLLERSWVLLGIERGTIFGSCDMDLGLPAWLALDKWMPWLFEVKISCGYTPVLFADYTMAEGLVVLSSLMLLVSSMLFISLILKIFVKAS